MNLGRSRNNKAWEFDSPLCYETLSLTLNIKTMEVTDTHRISLARCEDSFYTDVQTIRFMMSRYDLSEESAKELIADIKDRRQQVSDIVSQYFKPTKD